MANTTKNIRFTPEFKQERISRRQLQERIVEFGWLTAEPELDLGEDFIVHIYFDGLASGVTFHLQLKSVTNLIQRRKGDILSYKFPVKDLKHWSAFEFPVALMVWDVKLKEGRWILVEEAIKQLNETNPKWINRKTKVVVNIPWANNTNNEGFEHLRLRMGLFFKTIIHSSKDVVFKIQFVFPDTEEGLAVKDNFDRFIKEGEPVNVGAENIGFVKFPEWWEKWFLLPNTRFTELAIYPLIEDKTVCIDIHYSGKNGKSLSFENVQFRKMKSGAELTIFENDPSKCPLQFKLTLQKRDSTANLNLTHKFTTDSKKVLDIAKKIDLIEILESGGTILLALTDSNKSIARH